MSASLTSVHHTFIYIIGEFVSLKLIVQNTIQPTADSTSKMVNTAKSEENEISQEHSD
jgi:hypothetical protein